jgi:phasin family protein
MASTADQTTDAKADAAAEKAYAAAAGDTATKPVAAPAPAPAKIDTAVAEVKAAPKKPVARKAKPAAKKMVAKKAAKVVAPKKTAPRAKPTTKVARPTALKAPAKTAGSTVSQLKDKIMATTKTTTTDFTKTAKEAAADVQTRAKAAYDKLQAYAGEVTEFTKGNVEALVESGKIIGAGVQDLARGEVEAAKGAFETATADLKAMVAVKSPTELFKLQGEIARRNFDAAVARASKNAEVSLKLANDAFAPLSSRMSLAAEKISQAA